MTVEYRILEDYRIQITSGEYAGEVFRCENTTYDTETQELTVDITCDHDNPDEQMQGVMLDIYEDLLTQLIENNDERLVVTDDAGRVPTDTDTTGTNT